MSTQTFVKKLTEVLVRAFPLRWGKAGISVRKHGGPKDVVDVAIQHPARGRDTDAEKILSTFAAMFGLTTVNPGWFQIASPLALDAGSEYELEPLRLAGPAVNQKTNKIRALLLSGVEIRFDARSDEFQVDIAVFRGIDLAGADLSKLSIGARELSSENIKLQADFRGARPIEPLIACLKAVDLHESVFDDEQLSAICSLVERGPVPVGEETRESWNADNNAKSIVYNPLCKGEFLLRLERLATNDRAQMSAAMLCGAQHIPPDTAERFAALIQDYELSLLLDALRLNPLIRPILAARRIKLGSPQWRHLVPGSVVVRNLSEKRRLEDFLSPMAEMLACYPLNAGFDSDNPVTEDFPSDALSDRSAWWQKDSCQLALYWLCEESRFLALFVVSGGYVVATLDQPLQVFQELLPVLLIKRTEKLASERSELWGKMILLSESIALLSVAARTIADQSAQKNT